MSMRAAGGLALKWIGLLAMVAGLAGSGRPARAADQAGDKEGWVPLLKDDEMKEWQAGGGETAFSMKGGTLTVDGPGQFVFMGPAEAPAWKDLELTAEVLTKKGGRAGLTFHQPTEDARSSGGIEVRLDNTYSKSGGGRDFQKTGSLVWLRPVVKSVVPDEKWFPVRVRVQAPRVQVWVDGKLVIDYVEPADKQAVPRLRQGSVAIRGHDGAGAVQIRNLRVRPLPEDKSPPAVPGFDATDLRLGRLRGQGLPVVDLHTHLKGGLTLEEVLAHTWKTGIGHGIAVNVGVGFPITGDRGADAFLREVQGKPVFVGLQGEGREWVTLLSPENVARFDYVFTDAMTLTDPKGKRVRLWIKEEVEVPDPEAFMENLVKTTEGILDREPIDILVNPTYLPEVLARDHDKLWTPARLKRVVAALARNGVALEINDKLRLPGPAMIKMAKEAGVKFTFGTNNGDKTLGRQEYALKMIDECSLTPDDLWAPKPDGKKPVQVKKK